jgi:hypothetical protein
LEPIPAPPVPLVLLPVEAVLVAVDVVEGVVGVVVEVGVVVVLVVEVGVVVVLVVVFVVVLLVVVPVVVLEVVTVGVVVVVAVSQSRAASAAIVLAPWARFPCRVVLIVAGRRVTSSEKALAALAAPLQSPAATAEEIASSCVVSEFD